MIAAAQMEFFAGFVTEMKGSSIPMGPDVVNFSVREPLGVVGRIIPFNHPFMFCAGKSAAPLAAGNTVVVKPPEQAPLSSLRLAELIGGLLRPGAFNVVTGGREAGQRLARHPDVAMILATGGADGRAAYSGQAGKRTMLGLRRQNAMIAWRCRSDEVPVRIWRHNFTRCSQSAARPAEPSSTRRFTTQ
jgi:betaine-aldehyde dehydrogenase